MKTLLTLCCALAAVTVVLAQSTPVSGPPAGRRVVIDVSNPQAVEQFLSAVAAPSSPRRVTVDVGNPFAAEQFVRTTNPAACTDNRVVIDVSKQPPAEPAPLLAVGTEIPWETGQVMYTLTRQDSFLVRTSRTGCPGTEVGSSVSVAFATKTGWSDPIRFGPLDTKTTCPLGKGYLLDVSALGERAPRVHLAEPEPDLYTGRK